MLLRARKEVFLCVCSRSMKEERERERKENTLRVVTSSYFPSLTRLLSWIEKKEHDGKMESLFLERVFYRGEKKKKARFSSELKKWHQMRK